MSRARATPAPDQRVFVFHGLLLWTHVRTAHAWFREQLRLAARDRLTGLYVLPDLIRPGYRRFAWYA